MSLKTEPKNGPSLGSTFLLTLCLLLCLAITGGAGYVKLQLDKVEGNLATPEKAFSTEENLYEKTVLQLGYGGFLGAAQTFMSKMDREALNKMRQTYETASEAALTASKSAPPAVRRDVEAVLDLYNKILIRAETGGDALSSGITQSDLIMASTAMGTIDARLQTIEARRRVESEASFKQWSFALMVLAWGAALLATTLAVFAFGVQDKQIKSPLLALAQSVNNMTKGELDKSLWGLERNDEIGDLARSMDMARLYFAQIPDLTIAGDDGCTRFKFEGEARSLFKAMMENMSKHLEKAGQSTVEYQEKITQQQDTLVELGSRAKQILTEMEQQGNVNERIVRHLAGALEDSAHSLATSQERVVQNLRDAADALLCTQEDSARKLDNLATTFTSAQEKNAQQIAKIVPFLQERAQNMAEITQIAGGQITQSLSALLKAENTLRGTADQGQQSIKQLVNAAGQMSERMVSALGLMQASGKQFNESAEQVRARMSDVVESLTRGETGLYDMIDRAESRLSSTIHAEEKMAALASRTESSAVKMERAVDTIAQRHEMLNEQVVTAAHRMEAIMASFDSAERALNDATNHIRRDSSLISNLLSELRKNNDQLLVSLSQSSQSGFTAIQTLVEKSHALMQRLEVQIQNQAKNAEGHLDDLATFGQSMAQQTSATNGSLMQAVTALKTEQEKLASTRSRFTDTLSDLGIRLEQQATSTFGKTEEWASKSFVRLTGIAEQVENVMQRLSMLGQLTGTLGAVAGQLGQIVPALTQYGNALPAASSMSQDMNAPIIIDMDDTKELIVRQTQEVLDGIQSQWHQSTMQIEAMHDQLAQIIIQQKDQLETRLVVLDKKLRETNEILLETAEGDKAEEKRGEILDELVSAITKINEHVMELDEVVENAGITKKQA